MKRDKDETIEMTLLWWRALTVGTNFADGVKTLTALDAALGTELLPRARKRCPQTSEGGVLMDAHLKQIFADGLPLIPRHLRVTHWARSPYRAAFALWYGIGGMRGTCPIEGVEWEIGLIQRMAELQLRGPGLWGPELHHAVREFCGSVGGGLFCLAGHGEVGTAPPSDGLAGLIAEMASRRARQCAFCGGPVILCGAPGAAPLAP
jgi:hypothetical protein